MAKFEASVLSPQFRNAFYVNFTARWFSFVCYCFLSVPTAPGSAYSVFLVLDSKVAVEAFDLGANGILSYGCHSVFWNHMYWVCHIWARRISSSAALPACTGSSVHV